MILNAYPPTTPINHPPYCSHRIDTPVAQANTWGRMKEGTYIDICLKAWIREFRQHTPDNFTYLTVAETGWMKDSALTPSTLMPGNYVRTHGEPDPAAHPLSKDYCIFLIERHLHYVLCVATPQEIIVYDSNNRNPSYPRSTVETIYRKLRTLVHTEYATRECAYPYDIPIRRHQSTPAQQDSWSCGAHAMLNFILAALHGAPHSPNFNQAVADQIHRTFLTKYLTNSWVPWFTGLMETQPQHREQYYNRTRHTRFSGGGYEATHTDAPIANSTPVPDPPRGRTTTPVGTSHPLLSHTAATHKNPSPHNSTANSAPISRVSMPVRLTYGIGSHLENPSELPALKFPRDRRTEKHFRSTGLNMTQLKINPYTTSQPLPTEFTPMAVSSTIPTPDTPAPKQKKLPPLMRKHMKSWLTSVYNKKFIRATRNRQNTWVTRFIKHIEDSDSELHLLAPHLASVLKRGVREKIIQDIRTKELRPRLKQSRPSKQDPDPITSPPMTTANLPLPLEVQKPPTPYILPSVPPPSCYTTQRKPLLLATLNTRGLKSSIIDSINLMDSLYPNIPDILVLTETKHKAVPRFWKSEALQNYKLVHYPAFYNTDTYRR